MPLGYTGKHLHGIAVIQGGTMLSIEKFLSRETKMRQDDGSAWMNSAGVALHVAVCTYLFSPPRTDTMQP